MMTEQLTQEELETLIEAMNTVITSDHEAGLDTSEHEAITEKLRAMCWKYNV